MSCDEQVLLELLDGADVAAENEATRHIEVCPQCQRRLAELAADEDSWSDAAIALASGAETSVVVSIDAELSPDMPLQADRVSLDFLDPPSHPEMLGRVGRYDVDRLIGAGGMGIVLRAFDTELHRPVAIKVLAPHLAHSGAARQRFSREAQSAAAVVHENVVPIHNVDVAGKLPFLVMRFVAGDSLQARVDREGPLSNVEVLRIGAQIASGLAAAHEQGLVHRDVKPGNVLLEESVDRVLISDFGLARAADDASVTRSGVIAGTPHYMSPEQARGESIDGRSDLFGLGSVLYFMCTGRPPFRADGAMGTLHRICNDPHRPVDDVNEQVPAGLANLIDSLLEKDRTNRPATAADVSSQLTQLLHDKRANVRFRRRSRRTERWRRVVAVGATVVLAIGFWAASPWWNARRAATTSGPVIRAPDAPAPVAPAPVVPAGESVGDFSESAPRLVGEASFGHDPASDIESAGELPFFESAFHDRLDAANELVDDFANRPTDLFGEPMVSVSPWNAQFSAAAGITDAMESGATEFSLQGEDRNERSFDGMDSTDPVTQQLQ